MHTFSHLFGKLVSQVLVIFGSRVYPRVRVCTAIKGLGLHNLEHYDHDIFSTVLLHKRLDILPLIRETETSKREFKSFGRTH